MKTVISKAYSATSDAMPRHFKKNELSAASKQVDAAFKRICGPTQKSHPWKGHVPLSDSAKAARKAYLEAERQNIM